MQNNENKDELSIFELIDLFRRNLKLIIWSVIISLFITLLLTGISLLFNKNVANYSLTTQMSLTGEEITEQTVTVVVNSFSHSSIVTPALTKLGIYSSDYRIVAKRSHSVGILQLIVEGPNASLLTPLSNEVFNTVKPLVETAIIDLELRKLEISIPEPALQSTQARVNWILNSVLGILLGGMVSVFYIFAVYFMSPNIVEDNELETIFRTKILGRFINDSQKPTVRKFFEVR